MTTCHLVFQVDARRVVGQLATLKWLLQQVPKCVARRFYRKAPADEEVRLVEAIRGAAEVMSNAMARLDALQVRQADENRVSLRRAG